MSARLRRLMSDFDKIRNEFAGHRYIKVAPTAGDPPERYRIVYGIKSLFWEDRVNRPVESCRHEVEIYLPHDYPRNKPQCTIWTPIFHPNFSANHNPNIICIGDHWAASSSLVDIIIQIGEMLQYRTYNIKSPLNATAARWALQNEKFLPVGDVDLYQPEPEVELGASAQQEDDLDIVIASKPEDDLDIELK